MNTRQQRAMPSPRFADQQDTGRFQLRLSPRPFAAKEQGACRMSAQYEQSACFLSAVGSSFCEAVSAQPGYAEASPHDYQEVLWRVLGESFSPRELQAALSDEGIAAIAAECARYFETSPPAAATLRAALQQCLFRWPPDEAGDAQASLS